MKGRVGERERQRERDRERESGREREGETETERERQIQRHREQITHGAKMIKLPSDCRSQFMSQETKRRKTNKRNKTKGHPTRRAAQQGVKRRQQPALILFIPRP